jgi:hypothetical protein
MTTLTILILMLENVFKQFLHATPLSEMKMSEFLESQEGRPLVERFTHSRGAILVEFARIEACQFSFCNARLLKEHWIAYMRLLNSMNRPYDQYANMVAGMIIKGYYVDDFGRRNSGLPCSPIRFCSKDF